MTTTNEPNTDNTATRFDDATGAVQGFMNLSALLAGIAKIAESDEAHEIAGLCDVAQQEASNWIHYFQGIASQEVAAEAEALKMA